MEWLSVADAASKLNLSAPHVRRLLRDGALDSERVASSWLVSVEAVRDRQRRSHPAGRPVSAAMAWSFLWMIEAARKAEVDKSPSELDRLSAARGDRKQRYRLRRMLEEAPEPAEWSWWLRRRADPHRYWVHPAVLPRIERDPRLCPSGGSDREAQGVGNSAGPARRFYIDAGHLEAFLREHRAKDDPAGQVVLMVIPADVPEELLPEAGAPVPDVAALVDLLDSVDAREHHAAVAGLSDLAAKALRSR